MGRRRYSGRPGLDWRRILRLHQERPAAQLGVQKPRQHDRTDEECDEQFYREAAHRMPRYFFWPWAGVSPVLAISSRMAVSACMFFMR